MLMGKIHSFTKVAPITKNAPITFDHCMLKIYLKYFKILNSSSSNNNS